MNNIKSLQQRLPEGSLCLIQNPLNLRYFTGSDIDTGTLVISPQKASFITDFRYIEVAKKHFAATDILVVLQAKLNENIKALFEKNTQKLFVETDYQTISKQAFFDELGIAVDYSDFLEHEIGALREKKSEWEIEKIRQAQKITDDAFSHILKFIKVGAKEKDIALEIEYFMRKQGAQDVSFDLIVVSGKNTSLPHGVPSEKMIENGDFVTMDIGCKVGGYCSDMTRTVAVGTPSEKMKEVYEVVLQAQQKALEKIRAGARIGDVDKAARDHIYECGYKGCFGHSTGHGVGLYIHENPKVYHTNDSVLQENSVITVEPGIYLENEFGVRIEDMVLVTRDGYQNFTKSPKDLMIL